MTGWGDRGSSTIVSYVLGVAMCVILLSGLVHVAITETTAMGETAVRDYLEGVGSSLASEMQTLTSKVPDQPDNVTRIRDVRLPRLETRGPPRLSVSRGRECDSAPTQGCLIVSLAGQTVTMPLRVLPGVVPTTVSDSVVRITFHNGRLSLSSVV